jgi:hypothetical protein
MASLLTQGHAREPPRTGDYKHTRPPLFHRLFPPTTLFNPTVFLGTGPEHRCFSHGLSTPSFLRRINGQLWHLRRAFKTTPLREVPILKLFRTSCSTPLGAKKKMLLSEISNFNVPVKRRAFPKEAPSLLRDALECTLSLALSLHMNSPLALSAYSLSILFPRLLMRPLPNGCQGRFVDAVLRKRCELLHAGDIQRLTLDSHEA